MRSFDIAAFVIIVFCIFYFVFPSSGMPDSDRDNLKTLLATEMKMRDQFASDAMQAIILQHSFRSNLTYQEIALRAYAISDQMMLRRDK